LAWVRQYGRGRVFYCGFAHHPSVFWDPKMLQFYLAATQFALGDLPAPTTPSAKLTPAVQAQEKLGWRLGLVPTGSPAPTLFETIDKAAKLGFLYVGAHDSQKVSGNIPKTFDSQLSSDETQQIRLKLDAAGVRLLTYRVGAMPSNEADDRRVLEFARRMGIEALDIGLVQSVPSDADHPVNRLEKLCEAHSIRLAQCRTNSQGNIEPDRDIEPLRGAFFTPVRLSVIHHGRKPVMFSAEFQLGESAATPQLAEIVNLFNEATMRYANGGES
jgi:hypothetical protein